jgi:hypothetical protein
VGPGEVGRDAAADEDQRRHEREREHEHERRRAGARCPADDESHQRRIAWRSCRLKARRYGQGSATWTGVRETETVLSPTAPR